MDESTAHRHVGACRLRPSARGLCALWLVALLSLLPREPALAAGPASLIEWAAPDPCPGALEVYERLEAALGHELQTLGTLWRVRGSVVPAPEGYRLALEVLEPERRSSRLIESASCDELADAAVLAILLALSVEAPKARAAELSPGAPANEAPATTPSEAIAPEAASALEAASAPVRSRGFAAAAAVIELGALPHAALGLNVGAGVRFGALSLGGYGVLLAAEQLLVRPSQSVELELLFGGARACYGVLDSALRLDGCASFEAGRFSALGLDLDGPQRASDLWLAPGAALEAHWALSGALGLDGRVEGAAPLTRKQYTVNGTESVHAPAAVSLRAYLGLTLSTQ